MNKPSKTEDKACYYCVNNLNDIDYKDIRNLRRFVNIYKKILPRKRTGLCSKHQRKLSTAVKRARMMALLAYTHK